MKKITCREMGGDCNAEIHGETAEELMEKGRQHVHDAADSGDEAHKAVVKRMEELSDEDRDTWAEDMKQKFDFLQDVES
jgi:predicted small metal-binding protein